MEQRPVKRSKWESEPLSPDALEREAAEARARAAAKASRARAKKAAAASAAAALKEKMEREAAATVVAQQAASSSSAASSPAAAAVAAAPRPPRSAAHPVAPRTAYPLIAGCRPVTVYERLNHIEEGSYGIVFRARERETGEIVALKRLKMDKERNGFPVTSLREIRTLMEARHEHVVRVREIVVGDTLTQIYIVMDFVEHDLKALLQSMRTPFLASEIKTLLHQLLSAIALLHRSWIIHRDLKTSNLLMDNRGRMKLADFGLARLFGEPRGEMTLLVVTLWYRAPELLLGATTYGPEIDMWSVGCIFAELILKEPLLTGKNEADQLQRMFKLLGQPSDEAWPGYSRLPGAKAMAGVAQPFSSLRQRFRYSTDQTLDLLQRLLTYNPASRITAEEALKHAYFSESPAPAHPDTFATFPSVAAGEKKRNASPGAPERLADQKLAYQLDFDLP